MSTTGFQDAATSRAWQRAVADELVEGVGHIVAEFFDEGVSRRWSWDQRPAASALLAAAESAASGEPGRQADLAQRPFDAVVVGEYERAFYADQFQDVVARLTAVGVQVWLPEAGGPVELNSPVHQALLVLLGAQAQREVARARHRVLAAMSAQTRWQGRFLGGRPPYGYRLADAGPHPNSVHAGWGRRLHMLEPDPDTAPWVTWMFTERAHGRSIASITRELNDRGVPSPSAHDSHRNTHRAGQRWIVRTVAMILDNPRYTGRQVWNRHATTGHPTIGSGGGPRCGGRAGGRGAGVGRWNPVEDWVVSERPAHPALVDEDTFLTVQRTRAARPNADGGARAYLLAGLVVCGTCGRRMDGHWVHDRPAYRCRHGFTSGTPRPPGTRNTYRREDHLLNALPTLISAHTANATNTGNTAKRPSPSPAPPVKPGDHAHQVDRLDDLARFADLVEQLRVQRLVLVCGENEMQLQAATHSIVVSAHGSSCRSSHFGQLQQRIENPGRDGIPQQLVLIPD